MAGIKLTDPQWRAIVNAFKWAQRAIGLAQRSPLDQFLKKDEILAGEESPTIINSYTDQVGKRKNLVSE